MTRMEGLESFIRWSISCACPRSRLRVCVCGGVSARSGKADTIERINAKRRAAVIAIVDRLFVFIIFASRAKNSLTGPPEFSVPADTMPMARHLTGWSFPQLRSQQRWKHRRPRERPRLEVDQAPPSANLDDLGSTDHWRR